MKLKNLKYAALLAAVPLGAQSVSAATYDLYITGSNAFRSSVISASANILTNPVASFAGGTSLTTAIQVTYTGKVGADTWNLYFSSIGNEAAIKFTAQTSAPLPTLPYLTLANAQGAVTKGVAPLPPTGGTLAATPVFAQVTPQVTSADSWQASTHYRGSFGGSTYGPLVGPTIPGLPASVVGVQGYKFIASARDSAGNSYLPATFTGKLTTKANSTVATLYAAIPGLKDGALITGNPNIPFGSSIRAISGTSVTLSIPATAAGTRTVTEFSYDGIGNISTQLARKAFTSAGGAPAKLSQFSGSNADANITVYAVGRNHDAGQRQNPIFETGIDKPGTVVTAIQQYYPLDIDGKIIGTTGAGTTITDIELVPAEKVNGVSYLVGQSGYDAGGKAQKVFLATNALPNSLFLSYFAPGDAKTLLATGNAQELSYNGFYYSPTAIEQGQYTLWNYVHFYYLSSLNSKLKGTANLIAKQLAAADASVAGVKIDSNFKAVRIPATTDGAVVSR